MKSLSGRFSNLFTNGQAVWLIVAGLAIVSIFLSDTFLTERNIPNLLGQTVPLIIVTVGMFIAIIAGQIDLSVAALVKLTAVLVSGIGDGEMSKFLPAVALVYAIGLTVGLINSLLVVVFKVPSFIATLGMFSVLEGLVLAYTVKGVGSVPTTIVDFFYNRIGPLPYAFIALAVVIALVFLWFHYSRLALRMYAVGGDPEVARRSGVNSGPVITWSLVICSLFAVTAGLAQVSRAGVGAPTTGEGIELAAITAVIIGGASLMGGRGKLIGAIGGAILLALIDNSLNMIGVSQYSQGLFRGGIIVIAIALFVSKRGARQ
jgi:ribose transport system permease protein